MSSLGKKRKSFLGSLRRLEREFPRWVPVDCRSSVGSGVVPVELLAGLAWRAWNGAEGDQRRYSLSLNAVRDAYRYREALTTRELTGDSL